MIMNDAVGILLCILCPSLWVCWCEWMLGEHWWIQPPVDMLPLSVPHPHPHQLITRVGLNRSLNTSQQLNYKVIPHYLHSFFRTYTWIITYNQIIQDYIWCITNLGQKSLMEFYNLWIFHATLEKNKSISNM